MISDAKSDVITWVRPRMGTLLAITIAGGNDAERTSRAHAAFAEAARYERIMNRHGPESEIGRLNRSAGSPAGIIAPGLASILRNALSMSRMLEGAFDPTAGALIDLWRDSAARSRAPSPRAIAHALASVGTSLPTLAGNRIVLPHHGISLDLDAFAKGFALDRIAARLRRACGSSTFLNFGESSLLAIGAQPWTVLLRNPAGGFAGRFELTDGACSTSATSPRSIGGRVVDPRTGRQVAGTAQVTVLARSAAVAEAVSTALLVLGRDAVDRIAARMDVEICWVSRKDIYTTNHFPLDRAG